ncbi:MAG TPA: hypothetical protein V6D05_18340 [Stenomitos sp.]
MVTVALPLWLMVVIVLALIVLLVGALYGLTVFMGQLVGGQVDFKGSMPINEFTTVEQDHPELNPRLQGVDPRLADDLLHQAENNRKQP